MMSLNMMLVFAAVGTGYATPTRSIPDTRLGTTCAKMPATEEECRSKALMSVSMGVYSISDPHGWESEPAPHGCITLQIPIGIGSVSTRTYWNPLKSDGIRDVVPCETKDDVGRTTSHWSCVCVEADECFDDAGSSDPNFDYDDDNNYCETMKQMSPLTKDICGTFFSEGKQHGGWCNKKCGYGPCPPITPAWKPSLVYQRVRDEEWLLPSPIPPTPVSPGTEVIFHIDMFTLQCNPKLCGSWSCVDWCHCFESNPLVEQMFDSVAYGATLAGMCPPDDTQCEC